MFPNFTLSVEEHLCGFLRLKKKVSGSTSNKPKSKFFKIESHFGAIMRKTTKTDDDGDDVLEKKATKEETFDKKKGILFAFFKSWQRGNDRVSMAALNTNSYVNFVIQHKHFVKMVTKVPISRRGV